MAFRVVLAGGAGFIGRHVVYELLRRNQRVRIADMPDTANRFVLDKLGCDFIGGDLRDPTTARAALHDSDVCICLAARSAGIGFFNEHPAEMLDDNLRILSAIFEAARFHKFARMVYISSSCVFDRSTAHPITESALPLSPPPSSGYPFSKLAGEFYCKTFYEQHGLNFTVLRPFNVYGPGELPGNQPGDSHVIPDLTAKILAQQWPLEIIGDGTHTRSFTHVKDVAEGIVMAMENPRALNEDFNLGPPLTTRLGHKSEISILALAKKLWQICGRTEPFEVKMKKQYAVDVRQRAVDIKKATDLLGWEPTVDLDSGLTEYVSWYRMHTSVGSRT